MSGYLLAGLLAAGAGLIALASSRGSLPPQRGSSVPTTAATNEAPILQRDALDDLAAAGYGKPFLCEIAEGFARDGASLLADMGTALQVGDAAGFKDLAHTLKGNAVSVGAQRLAQTCQQLERLERPATASLSGLREEFDRAIAALNDYLARST